MSDQDTADKFEGKPGRGQEIFVMHMTIKSLRVCDTFIFCVCVIHSFFVCVYIYIYMVYVWVWSHTSHSMYVKVRG